MRFPNFTDPQFLDANSTGGLNTAFGTVSGAVASAGSGVWSLPGLVCPESMTTSFSGLVATIGLPLPWGVVSGGATGGAIVRAHGTQTNGDTTSYSVDFTSLVPGSGSITAYLAATILQIQQNPFPIPGPPPGHPNYDPNYVPINGYASNVYSVSLSAVSAAPDNSSSFELLRTTLTAGQSVISVYSTIGQQRAAERKVSPGSVLASGGALTAQQAQYVLTPAVSGLASTLPPVSGAGGLYYQFVNTSNGPWTLSTTGADQIMGFGPSGVSSLVLNASGAVNLWANPAVPAWETLATSPDNTGWKTIGKYVISALSSSNILLPVAYERFRLTLESATVTDLSNIIQARVSSDGGSTFYSTASYTYLVNMLNSAGSGVQGVSLTSTYMPFSPALRANGLGAPWDVTIQMWPGNPSSAPRFYGEGLGVGFDNSAVGGYLAGSWGGVSATMNCIQLSVPTGTFSCKVILEGLPV